ncbi:MAG TPA: hypothetical protein PL143_04990 [Rhodocyclaceae bacterium]|nr:hypothetical protein [Rhodocyclaceae bacterium]
MRHRTVPLLVTFCALSTGCASITTGHNQSLSVETRADGRPVAGAHCKLENDKGTWFATSPGTVVVRRSYNDLNVRCEKDGHEPGITAAKSSTKGMAFGNILFGGVIGAAVDVGSGAAYDYPSIISVELGRRRTQQPDAPAASTGDGAPSDGAPAAETGDQISRAD